MGLLRAAFQCENGIIQVVVLCVECYSELATRVDTPRWNRELDVGTCEFCAAEIRADATGQ